jgi:HK97 family phage prohead protease
MNKPFRRLVQIADPDMQLDEATGRASFIFNTEDVGRDGHIVRNAGIRLDGYKTNPVILWAHDDSAPPVGRAVDIQVGNPSSRVAVEFTPAEIYPFGAMIGRMVKARYLNAVSESWNPIKAKLRAGGEGYDFTEVDLLEISIVPVPALPQAIATARSAGIDTSPMVDWSERHLDTGIIDGIDRGQLLMLRKAAAGRSVAFSLPLAGAERRTAIARELLERGQRQNIALREQARGTSKLPQASRTALEAVQRHHERCEQSRAALSRRHARLAAHVTGLDDISQRLHRAVATSDASRDKALTLALADLQRCADNIDIEHDGAIGDVENLGNSLAAATGGVTDVIDGIAELDDA